jgi:hypothetical protein
MYTSPMAACGWLWVVGVRVYVTARDIQGTVQCVCLAKGRRLISQGRGRRCWPCAHAHPRLLGRRGRSPDRLSRCRGGGRQGSPQVVAEQVGHGLVQRRPARRKVVWEQLRPQLPPTSTEGDCK